MRLIRDLQRALGIRFGVTDTYEGQEVVASLARIETIEAVEALLGWLQQPEIGNRDNSRYSVRLIRSRLQQLK